MIVIGAGRVGQALAARDPDLPLLGREDDPAARLEGRAPAPIFVATRNDDLAAVIEAVPADRRGDLVFTQNGMLRDFLAAQALGDATRGLLFFAVAKRGEPLTPGGTSPFCGPRAPEVVAWMHAHEVPAEVVEPEAFALLELEKLAWNCSFGLACEAFGLTVGEVVETRRETIDTMVAEMVRVGAPAVGLEASKIDAVAMAARCCDYSRSIPSYRGAVKEWTWRNGWFVETSAREGIEMSVHAELLAKVGRG